MTLTADEVVRLLELSPHPEGGFYRETFRAPDLPVSLPDRGVRAASTAIHFLLRRVDFSALHRVRSDEAWHHYLGAPLELHLFDDAGHTELSLGADLARGEHSPAIGRSSRI